jgi:tetratricopeptide (TPR) repeat protein
MDEIIQLCERGNYTEALKLIERYETNKQVSSELFRIKGQAQMELGRYDDAIDSLVESLKLDPKNESALTLVGNIYAGQKHDVETAMIYYEKVLDLNSENYIGISNIAGIIAKQGNYEKAKRYFLKALIIKEDHPHALYGLALTESELGNVLDGFDQARLALLAAERLKEEKVLSFAYRLMLSMAEEYLKDRSADEVYSKLLKETKEQSGKDIEVQIDPNLPTPAKIRIAEYHNLPKHQILIRENNAVNAYYVLHELMHLRLIIEARKINENELFTSNEATYNSFRKKVDKYTKTIVKNGVPEESLEKLFAQLYNGLLLQMYNAPIDLFIEQRIFETPEYRPVQVLGLIQMIQSAIQAASDRKLSKIVPHLFVMLISL